MHLSFEIVTPTGIVYQAENVNSVTLPTTAGELGILPGHIPLTAEVEPGEIDVETSAGTTKLAVDKGYARVLADRVSVLAEAAIDVKAIDLSAVEDAQKRAEAALEAARHQKAIDPAELERLEAVARFAIAQKLAKTKH
ncbi:MAG: ATP synthase F1 subunit epsilon [Opitutales bacterium]|nr:ATP synthase F1 subunit epsilon [Opitutales bacterium]